LFRKRKGFYGSFLLACYDEDSDRFQSVTMTGSGLKDEDLENFYNELNKYVIKEPRKDYDIGNVTVDVWFESKIVWEIKTADLSKSTLYTAANNITDDERGISLRFPRFIRERPDKKPEECTSSSDIYKLFKDQDKSAKKTNYAEEEFYD